MKIRFHIVTALLMAASANAAIAQDSARLHMRSLAATCASCHGTDGRTTEGSAIPSLAGMPKSYMVMQMKAFKEGTRPATVMHQISKGITDQQIDSMATYFSDTKRQAGVTP
ncbi:MAG: c-type cytochrome [Burkholderiaceae bacterium]|nr:c-type cytochrome [Burkholderiaceae bacterium]